MINENELPENWEIKKLGDTVTKRTLKALPTDAPDAKFIGMDCIEPNGLMPTFLYDFKDFKSAGNRFKSGQVLYGRMRPYLNKVYKAEFDGVCSGEFIILECLPVFIPELLKYILHSRDFVRFVNAKTSGDRPRVSYEEISDYPIYLPPLAEQERIVAKIEELFSELDAGLKSLKTAQAQLKTYRQAVLKYAFEGKLTNENLNEGELPNDWKLVMVKDVANTYGGYAFKSGEFNSNGKYQVIRMGNVRPGIIRLNESPVFLDKIEPTVLNRSLLKLNDVIITQTGTRKKRDYGFTALIQTTNLLLNQRLTSIRFHNSYLPKFFLYFSWTDEFKDQFFANETGNVGQGNVGMKAITETLIPLCSLEEQQRIVEEIESRLSVCDKLEETINASLKQAEALRQSILKQAFEGKLIKPKEIEKPKRTPFYQMQTLGLIVDRSKQRNIRHGEMTLAKYAFLADKIYGVPIYENYQRWHLGPYPTEIKKTVNNREYFKIENNTIQVLNEEKLFKYNNDYIEQIETAIDELAEIFLTFEPKDRSHKTELLATVCKVIEDIQTTEIKAVRQSMAEWKIDLKDKRFNNKAEKFDEKETAKCVEFIKGKGWDKKLIK